MAARRTGKRARPKDEEHVRLRKEAVGTVQRVLLALRHDAGQALTTKWAEQIVDDLTDYVLEAVRVDTEAKDVVYGPKKGRKG